MTDLATLLGDANTDEVVRLLRAIRDFGASNCSGDRDLSCGPSTPTPDSIDAVSLEDVRSLLDAPSPAALVTYRSDGSADVSPVWYRCTDSAFEVIVAADDPKLRRLAVDDRVVLTVFETVPPFRGVKVAGRVTPDRDPTVVREAREAMASRYLGETRGAAFVESRGPGVVIRLPIASARAWDLEAALPPTDDQGT
jgi:hypothetical protein